MNCYYHREVTAIAICRACEKGLCGECAAEVNHGVACINRCEDRAKMIDALIDQNQEAIDKNWEVLRITNARLKRNVFFAIPLGILFVLMGVGLGFHKYGMPGILFVLMGIVFSLSGILGYTRSNRYPESPTDTEQGGKLS